MFFQFLRGVRPTNHPSNRESVPPTVRPAVLRSNTNIVFDVMTSTLFIATTKETTKEVARPKAAPPLLWWPALVHIGFEAGGISSDHNTCLACPCDWTSFFFTIESSYSFAVRSLRASAQAPRFTAPLHRFTANHRTVSPLPTVKQ